MKISVLSSPCPTRALARRVGTDPETLLRINDLPPTELLPEGMSLLLPDRKERRKIKGELFLLGEAQQSTPWDYASAVCFPQRLSQLETPDEAYGREFCRQALAAYALPLLGVDNRDEDGFYSPELAHQLLWEEAVQERFFMHLTSRIHREGWQGLALAMAYLFPFDRDRYGAFVRRISLGLHQAGLWLYLMLPADVARRPNLRRNGALDPAMLGASCDRLVLLEPPCAGAAERQENLESMTSVCDAGKLMLFSSGASLFRERKRGGESPRRRGSALTAHHLAAGAGARITRGEKGGVVAFSCRAADGKTYAVRYADALWGNALVSAAGKYALAGLGLSGTEAAFPGQSELLAQRWESEKLI